MAYDNLSMPISVVDAARNTSVYYRKGMQTPLYNETGEKIEQQDLITIRPDGTTFTHLMAEMTFSDLKVFFDELDVALRHSNPFIQNLFAKNAKQLAQLIRVVNYNNRSGFKGSVGSGNQLDALMLRAEQHQNPDAAGIAVRASWIRAVAASSTLQFICAQDALGANAHAALTMQNTEGYALLGFHNPSATPVTSAYQIQYLGVNYNIRNLDFQKANPIYGDAVVELPQPLFIYPGETALVNVRYFLNGADELTPIGLWIKTAANLRALATS